MDHLPRLGKRELIYLLLFTCNNVVSVGEVSSSSGFLGWATLFNCGTPLAFHIIISWTSRFISTKLAYKLSRIFYVRYEEITKYHTLSKVKFYL